MPLLTRVYLFVQNGGLWIGTYSGAGKSAGAFVAAAFQIVTVLEGRVEEGSENEGHHCGTVRSLYTHTTCVQAWWPVAERLQEDKRRVREGNKSNST